MADSTQNGTRIEFRNITKVFQQKKAEVKALDDVSLTVDSGEIIGIIGYSGAGKSTLVRMINGLDTPTSGELLLDGQNIVGMSEKKLRGIRRNIGMIFQQFNLMNSRTAAGNIEYPLQPAAKSSAWASRAPWPRIRRCCLPTKPHPPSTPPPRRRSSTCCAG